VHAHPRTDHFKEDIIQAFYEGIKHKPETTFGNVKADVLADKDPAFRRGNFCSVIRGSAWPAWIKFRGTLGNRHCTNLFRWNSASVLRKLIVEFIGTFFLVYVIGCVSLQEHVLLGPLAIGASLMVMIFTGGHISGGHYNPAVTLGVWIRGACSTLEAGFYLVVQVIGAIVAALAAAFLLGHGSSPAASTVTVAQVMLAEALETSLWSTRS
jgi:glycerol uptake facilitator-like aquaporin